ncbi:MAG: DNA-binding protein [Acidobacteria bacterium]|nr:MAG: DNA-binding protein [Acidobacteriota bacterium]PYU52604.1 MAG: DNA-binding protein [Acidobacteriota bacterium]
MSVRAGGAEDMFLDAKELAVHKLRIRKTYAPGSIDFHSAEIKQIEPLEVTATAELLEGQIRIDGTLETKIELVCARCLEPVVEEVSRTFDLFYAPLPKDIKHKEDRLKDDDTEIGFYDGPGLFLADVLKEQVLLALPLKVICQSDCRGLCPNCGANLNHEECRCETHAMDPRMAPLARLKQEWLKKQ